jgi:hypothetical protein
MAASAPLRDAWDKLERAKAHVDEIVTGLPEPNEQGNYPIPFRREYDADEGAVLWIAEGVPDLRDELPLIVGDALHNFRSCLDHAWWELTCRNLGREPTEKEAPSVQFPIRKPGANFNFEANAKWAGSKTAHIAESVQPDKGWDPDGRSADPFVPPNPVGALRFLSNIDKHRVLTTVVLMVGTLYIKNPNPEQFIDCEIDPNRTREGSGLIQLPDSQIPVKSGNEVLRFYVTATGPNPDVNIDPKPSAQVTIERKWNLVPLLSVIGTRVDLILKRFERLMEGRAEATSGEVAIRDS